MCNKYCGCKNNISNTVSLCSCRCVNTQVHIIIHVEYWIECALMRDESLTDYKPQVMHQGAPGIQDSGA